MSDVANIANNSGKLISQSAKAETHSAPVVKNQVAFEQASKAPRIDVKEDTNPRAALEQAVVELNKYVQKTQRDLQFSIDEETGTTVVKVLDRNSGDLIRQIPDSTLLELARQVARNDHLNLLSTTG